MANLMDLLLSSGSGDGMGSKCKIFIVIFVIGMIPNWLAAQGALETGTTVLRSTYPLDSLSQGWKPNLVEDGGRDDVDRMNGPISPARQPLALAEAMSLGDAEAVFVENAFATGLWNEAPQAVAVLMAIGNYNHFFANHVE